AGAYTAAQCHPGYGAQHEDAAFSRSSADFAGAAACAHGDGGLRLTHSDSPTLAGRRAAWSFAAPAGSAIVAATLRTWGVADGGLVPEFLTGTPGAMRSAGRASGGPHRVSWSGLARDVSLRL